MRNKETSPTLRVMPRHQETDVPRDATLFVSASRPIGYSSATRIRVRTEDRDVDGVIDTSSDGRILFWRPSAVLQAKIEHQITISGVRDTRGAPFDDLSTTFITGHFSYLDLSMVAE